MLPDQRPPACIYIISIILALPATWLIVGVAGEDVPGMIAMIVMIVLIVAISAALNWLRLSIRNRSR